MIGMYQLLFTIDTCCIPLSMCSPQDKFTILARIFESRGRVDTGGHFEFSHMGMKVGHPAPHCYVMTLYSAVGYQSIADQRRSNPPPYFRGARDLLPRLLTQLCIRPPARWRSKKDITIICVCSRSRRLRRLLTHIYTYAQI